MSKYTNARQRAYSDMVFGKCFDKYKEIFGDGTTARTVARAINTGSTTTTSVDAIIKLIVTIFKSKGFTEEEAIKYLNENKRIFELSYDQVFTSLALVDTAGLSEKAVFENQNFMIRSHDLKKLYNAVRICRRDNETPTLEAITALELNDEQKIEFEYKKPRIDMYKNMYKAKILKELSEQKEKEGSTLKRTEK